MAKKRKKVKIEPPKVVPKKVASSRVRKKSNKWDAVLFISLVLLVMIPILVFVIVASNIDDSLEIQIAAAYIVLRELYFLIAVWFLGIIVYLEWRRS